MNWTTILDTPKHMPSLEERLSEKPNERRISTTTTTIHPL